MYDVNPLLFGQTNNFITKADNYGTQTNHWNGVEIGIAARVRQGLTFQGGTSTGRTTTDNCEIRAKLPEMPGTAGLAPAALNPYCHVEPPFRTQFKGLASYTIPKIDVQVSGAIQSLPGSQLRADFSVLTTVVAQSLGRPLAGNQTSATINLVQPGDVYGDRVNQIDIRAGKIVKFGRIRSQFSVDLYNALNSSAIQTYNQNFIANGAWLTPTLILPARFAKLTAQIDF